jgi:hypothetical protein
MQSGVHAVVGAHPALLRVGPDETVRRGVEARARPA